MRGFWDARNIQKCRRDMLSPYSFYFDDWKTRFLWNAPTTIHGVISIHPRRAIPIAPFSLALQTLRSVFYVTEQSLPVSARQHQEPHHSCTRWRHKPWARPFQAHTHWSVAVTWYVVWHHSLVQQPVTPIARCRLSYPTSRNKTWNTMDHKNKPVSVKGIQLDQGRHQWQALTNRAMNNL